mmetsp:Transcript_52653/g.139887  ORF Transcript_52653/g.139887 Transcript_52653/m.139887 type:complete len:346 (+) Transcript_52653:3127-4164(+)
MPINKGILHIHEPSEGIHGLRGHHRGLHDPEPPGGGLHGLVEPEDEVLPPGHVALRGEPGPRGQALGHGGPRVQDRAHRGGVRQDHQHPGRRVGLRGGGRAGVEGRGVDDHLVDAGGVEGAAGGGDADDAVEGGVHGGEGGRGDAQGGAVPVGAAVVDGDHTAPREVRRVRAVSHGLPPRRVPHPRRGHRLREVQHDLPGPRLRQQQLRRPGALLHIRHKPVRAPVLEPPRQHSAAGAPGGAPAPPAVGVQHRVRPQLHGVGAAVLEDGLAGLGEDEHVGASEDEVRVVPGDGHPPLPGGGVGGGDVEGLAELGEGGVGDLVLVGEDQAAGGAGGDGEGHVGVGH